MPIAKFTGASEFGLVGDDPSRQGFVALPTASIYQQTPLWPVVYRAGTAEFGVNPGGPMYVSESGMGGNYAQQVGSVYQPMSAFPTDPRAGQIDMAPIPGPSNYNGVRRSLAVYDLLQPSGTPYQIFDQSGF